MNDEELATVRRLVKDAGEAHLSRSRELGDALDREAVQYLPDLLAERDQLAAEVERLTGENKTLGEWGTGLMKRMLEVETNRDEIALMVEGLTTERDRLAARCAELEAAAHVVARLFRHIPHHADNRLLMDALNVSYEVHDDEPTVADLRKLSALLRPE
jgi:hypothetical protein